MSHRRSRRYANASRVYIPKRVDAADWTRVPHSIDPIVRLAASLDPPEQAARRRDAAFRAQAARDAAVEEARRVQAARQKQAARNKQAAVQAEAIRAQEAAIEAAEEAALATVQDSVL
jgi:hypothetical protein